MVNLNLNTNSFTIKSKMEKGFEFALAAFLEQLEGKGVVFAWIGTVNLLVQGINVVPHDLDFLTNDEGIKKIGQVFDSKIVEEKEDHYQETKFRIGKIGVQVVSNRNNPMRPGNFEKDLVWITKGNFKIPCMSLQSELSFHRRLGRAKDLEKVQLIAERLKNNRMLN